MYGRPERVTERHGGAADDRFWRAWELLVPSPTLKLELGIASPPLRAACCVLFDMVSETRWVRLLCAVLGRLLPPMPSSVHHFVAFLQRERCWPPALCTAYILPGLAIFSAWLRFAAHCFVACFRLVCCCCLPVTATNWNGRRVRLACLLLRWRGFAARRRFIPVLRQFWASLDIPATCITLPPSLLYARPLFCIAFGLPPILMQLPKGVNLSCLPRGDAPFPPACNMLYSSQTRRCFWRSALRAVLPLPPFPVTSPSSAIGLVCRRRLSRNGRRGRRDFFRVHALQAGTAGCPGRGTPCAFTCLFPRAKITASAWARG